MKTLAIHKKGRIDRPLFVFIKVREKTDCYPTQTTPKERIRSTNLSVQIKRHPMVIPDGVFPIPQDSAQILDSCYACTA